MKKMWKRIRAEVRNLSYPDKKELMKMTATSITVALIGAIIVSLDIQTVEMFSKWILSL